MKALIYTSLVLSLVGCTAKTETNTAEKTATLVNQNPFNPDAGKLITDDDAKKWAKAFDTKYPGAMRGYYFGADVYKKALETKGATGLRIWQGINDAGEQVMMIAPTDSTGETIFGNTIYEFGQPCPPFCDTL